jgi:hypothetical protein
MVIIATERSKGEFIHAIIPILIRKIGQNRISTPYMTSCMVITLLKIPYVHRIHL